MLDLKSLAAKEGEIPLTQFGSGTFAEGVCRAQNLAEEERFSDAASMLSSLITDNTASDWRQMLEARIEILTKWAESGMAGLDEYHRFYLETGPRWFHNRARPIVTLWQIEQLPQVEKHFLLAALLEKKGDVRGQTLALLVIPHLPDVDAASSAKALLAVGTAFHKFGDVWDAKKAWSRVRRQYRTTSTWPKAVFNLGFMEKKQRKYLEAVKYFDEILELSPNDKEPGGNIMAVYRNYSHRSALEISNCYEEMGKYRKALHYTRLAKTRYPYRSWCGTCLASSDGALNKRIANLKDLMTRSYGIWAIVTVLGVLAIAGIRSYQRRKKVSEPNEERLSG